MFKPTKIFVPTDFSEYSDKALEEALDISQHYRAKVFLLHVLNENKYPVVVDFHFCEQWQQLEDHLWEETREKFRNQLNKFPQASGLEIVTNIRQGVLSSEILREVEERGIDLIVIASHGRSGIVKNLIGGTAHKFLRGSQCRVLLTR